MDWKIFCQRDSRNLFVFICLFLKEHQIQIFKTLQAHPTSWKSAIWQKETHCLFKRLVPQTALYDLNTCHHFMITCGIIPKRHLWRSLSFCLHKFLQFACGNVQTKVPHLSYCYWVLLLCLHLIWVHLNQSPGAYSSIPEKTLCFNPFLSPPEYKWRTLKQFRQNQYFYSSPGLK